MTDYELFLQEMGLSEAQAEKIKQNPKDQVGMPHDALVVVSESSISGMGIFVKKDVYAGTTLSAVRVCGFRTAAGAYVNHDAKPNALMVKDNAGNINLVAITDIKSGVEATVCYRQSMRLR
jgi:hypothetical protein